MHFSRPSGICPFLAGGTLVWSPRSWSRTRRPEYAATNPAIPSIAATAAAFVENPKHAQGCAPRSRSIHRRFANRNDDLRRSISWRLTASGGMSSTDDRPCAGHGPARISSRLLPRCRLRGSAGFVAGNEPSLATRGASAWVVDSGTAWVVGSGTARASARCPRERC
jgi:hypothetical protein